MSTKAPGEILELFRGGYLSMAETIDALDGVEGYVSVELLNIERTISDDLRAQNAKLREELRDARVPQMLRCDRCGSSGDVFMMCAGCQSPLASTAETLWEALEPFGKLAALFDEYEVDRRSPEKDSVLVNVKLNDLRKARALTSTERAKGTI